MTVLRCVVLWIAVLAGCDHDCDPGQRYSHGLCYDMPDASVASAAGVDALTDAGATTPDGAP